jgi:hypothetical protein
VPWPAVPGSVDEVVGVSLGCEVTGVDGVELSLGEVGVDGADVLDDDSLELELLVVGTLDVLDGGLVVVE